MLTLMGDESTIPWRVLSIDFLVQDKETGGDLLTDLCKFVCCWFFPFLQEVFLWVLQLPWWSSINFWSPEGKLRSPKIPPPFFSNKISNTNKKCMIWTFFLCSKIALLSLPIPESNHTCTSEVFFFHKLSFWDIKLSDLEHRNRKLSAHDCTDHIKTLWYFLPITTAKRETRNINTSQAAMLLVPGHNCTTLLVPVYKVHNIRWKQHGGLETFNSYWS